MSRTRIKFCGMTRAADAVRAAEIGVDAIGLVFSARSRRCITLAQAGEISRALPPFVARVALFMDDAPELVRAVLDALRPDVLQFHGAESDAWCAQFGWPCIKAVAMGGDASPRVDAWPGVAALLLDGHVDGAPGGSGAAFDWSRVPRLDKPWILAGGLNPETVAAAIAQARPWAVDVSSGIESSPGIKDAAKMRAFVNAVHATDKS